MAKMRRRNGRRLQMMGALAGAAARNVVKGLGVRAAGKIVKTAMKRHGMKALAGGAGAAAAYTGYRGMAATQRRATVEAGVKRVRMQGDMGGTAKRLNFGAGSSTSRRVRVPGTEWVTVRSSVGRKRPMTVKRLSKVTTQRRIFRFQNVAPIDRVAAVSDRGAFMLSTVCTNTAVIPATMAEANVGGYARQDVTGTLLGNLTNSAHFLATPVNVFLLNGTRDRANNGRDVGYRLFISNNDTGTLVWSPLTGVRPVTPLDLNPPASGIVPTTHWDLEYASGDFGSAILTSETARYIQNDWYDIKLCLRNAGQQRTFYDVQIVSFADEWLDPLGVPADSDQVRDRHNLWLGYTRKNTNHPLQTDKNYASIKKKMIVHKSMRVEMDMSLTNQVDGSPNFKVVKIFYRDGALNDYATSANANVVQGTTADQLLNANVYETVGLEQTNYNNIPKPRARKWLVVSAFDPSISALGSALNPVDNIAGNTVVPNVNPTYDIIIRKKETRFPDFTS